MPAQAGVMLQLKSVIMGYAAANRLGKTKMRF